MKQTTLTQSGAPGRVIGWTNFSHKHSMHGFCRNFQHYTGFVYYLFLSFWWVLSFLYVYSDHSILECYNLFSGVELSMRSFFVISTFTFGFLQCCDIFASIKIGLCYKSLGESHLKVNKQNLAK